MTRVLLNLAALLIVGLCVLFALSGCGGSFEPDDAVPATNCGANFVGPVTADHPACEVTR